MMNERIRELYNKASVYAYEQNPGENSYGRPVDENKYEEDRYTKFAELIVRECCSKLEEMGDGWHEFARNPPDGQAHNASGALFAAYRLKEDAVDEIKQHFGVEE